MIECTRFKPHQKGHLVGFADIYIDKWEAEIQGVAFFNKNGQRWITLPGKEYEKDGEKKFAPFLRFRETQTYRTFVEHASKAIDRYIADGLHES